MTADGLGPERPGTPAFGEIRPASQRRRTIVVIVVVAVVGLLLIARVTGALRDDNPLPPLNAVAMVVPGIVRGAQPKDIDLLRLHDDYAVRGVVVVGSPSYEEQAAARELGLSLLPVEPAADPPSPDQVHAVVRFVQRVDPLRDGSFVYIHDITGTGPVITIALMLQLLSGEQLPVVLERLDDDQRAALRPTQLQALSEVAAAARGDARAAAGYGALIGVKL